MSDDQSSTPAAETLLPPFPDAAHGKADEYGITVVSMKRDWKTVLGDA